MKLPAGIRDHPDAGRAILECPIVAGSGRRSDRRHDHGKFPARRSAPARPAARSAAGPPPCRAPWASRADRRLVPAAGRCRGLHRCGWLRRRRARWLRAEPGAPRARLHVPTEQFVPPPLRRSGQIGIRVQAEEGFHVLHPAARPQPLPQRGLRHLCRRFGGVHHVDIERALGPAAAAVIDQVLEGARGPAEAGLRHVDQGRQLLRLQPIAGSDRGDAEAHQAARQALDGHRQLVAVRVGRAARCPARRYRSADAGAPRPQAADWRRRH